jgi:hypothetical protein
MKVKFNKSLFLLLFLFTSACQNVKIGIEPSPTPLLPPTLQSTSTPQPTTTRAPVLDTATPTNQLTNYSQSTYGFSFTYPSNWGIQQEKNKITLTRDSFDLHIGFKKDGEDVSIISVTQPQSPLTQLGTLNFLTETISRDALLSGNEPIAIYYNNGEEIKSSNNILFTFYLLPDQQNSLTGIDSKIQEEADQIIESFVTTYDLTESTCSDNATFVQDVTVLDDTRFSPGENFTKTWRLSNSGTCTWTSNYALIFADGDQMSGESPQLFTTEVIPGQTIDLSVDLTAPASNGTYRGNWLLRNEKGDLFGLGTNGDKPFWVQITVGETTPDIRQTLGEPSFKDTLASTNNWYLLDTQTTKFSAGDNALIMTAISPGKNDEWGIANIPPLKDFYLELSFQTTEPCLGLDRYGVIFRAPEPNQGYVFGFSCDGRYRLYKWDGKTYQAIQEWKNSPLIKSGSDQSNRLGVYAVGNDLKLYANGQLLAEYNDVSFQEGRFGIFIGAEKTDNFKVLLDEAAYWKIGN